MGVMQFRLSISTNCREYFRGSWWVVGNNPFENVPVATGSKRPKVAGNFFL